AARRAAAARGPRGSRLPDARGAGCRRRPRGSRAVIPPAEHVHWLFATGLILVALTLLAEMLVGPEVWKRRAWRAYLWPGLLFASRAVAPILGHLSSQAGAPHR